MLSSFVDDDYYGDKEKSQEDKDKGKSKTVEGAKKSWDDRLKQMSVVAIEDLIKSMDAHQTAVNKEQEEMFKPDQKDKEDEILKKLCKEVPSLEDK